MSEVTMNTYRSVYPIDTIDEIINKGLEVKLVRTGWSYLQSTSIAPIDFDTYWTEGNYYLLHYINGPFDNIMPVNLSIIKITLTNDTEVLVQIIMHDDSIFMRNRASMEWYSVVLPGDPNPIIVSDIQPTPVHLKTVWITNDNGVYKIYVAYNGEFVECINIDSTKYILDSALDPTNVNSDIYAYIDTKISIPSVAASVELTTHMNNNDIHLTTEEKNAILGGVSKTTVDEAISNYTLNTLSGAISTIVLPLIETMIPSLADSDQRILNMDTHMNNATIHSSALINQIASNASLANHMHINDNRVRITTDNVIGTVTITDEQVNEIASEVVATKLAEVDMSAYIPAYLGDKTYDEVSALIDAGTINKNDRVIVGNNIYSLRSNEVSSIGVAYEYSLPSPPIDTSLGKLVDTIIESVYSVDDSLRVWVALLAYEGDIVNPILNSRMRTYVAFALSENATEWVTSDIIEILEYGNYVPCMSTISTHDTGFILDVISSNSQMRLMADFWSIIQEPSQMYLNAHEEYNGTSYSTNSKSINGKISGLGYETGNGYYICTQPPHIASVYVQEAPYIASMRIESPRDLWATVHDGEYIISTMDNTTFEANGYIISTDMVNWTHHSGMSILCVIGELYLGFPWTGTNQLHVSTDRTNWDPVDGVYYNAGMSRAIFIDNMMIYPHVIGNFDGYEGIAKITAAENSASYVLYRYGTEIATDYQIEHLTYVPDKIPNTLFGGYWVSSTDKKLIAFNPYDIGGNVVEYPIVDIPNRDYGRYPIAYINMELSLVEPGGSSNIVYQYKFSDEDTIIPVLLANSADDIKKQYNVYPIGNKYYRYKDGDFGSLLTQITNDIIDTAPAIDLSASPEYVFSRAILTDGNNVLVETIAISPEGVPDSAYLLTIPINDAIYTTSELRYFVQTSEYSYGPETLVLDGHINRPHKYNTTFMIFRISGNILYIDYLDNTTITSAINVTSTLSVDLPSGYYRSLNMEILSTSLVNNYHISLDMMDIVVSAPQGGTATITSSISTECATNIVETVSGVLKYYKNGSIDYIYYNSTISEFITINIKKATLTTISHLSNTDNNKYTSFDYIKNTNSIKYLKISDSEEYLVYTPVSENSGMNDSYNPSYNNRFQFYRIGKNLANLEFIATITPPIVPEANKLSVISQNSSVTADDVFMDSSMLSFISDYDGKAHNIMKSNSSLINGENPNKKDYINNQGEYNKRTESLKDMGVLLNTLRVYNKLSGN